MGKVITDLTMSLDGFIAGPDDDIGHLFKWYSLGDTDFPLPGTDRVFKMSQASADLLNTEWAQIGAIVTGRRDFDVSKAWGGTPPLDVPVFIVTHNPDLQWVYDGSPFTFVTDGVTSAIEQAKVAAGSKNVVVGGSTIVQQCLNAGLLDEIHIHLAPILLGTGIRLFANLSAAPLELECTRLIEGTGITHLTYRVIM